VVAKGVSSPNLGLWLLICLFSNKSAAYLAALLHLESFSSNGWPLQCSTSHIDYKNGHPKGQQ
jgi:hypothetical protein